MSKNLFTEKPPVYEARQVDSDDKNSDWVVVNTQDESDVRTFSNEAFKARFSRSRAKVDPVPGVQPEDSVNDGGDGNPDNE